IAAVLVLLQGCALSPGAEVIKAGTGNFVGTHSPVTYPEVVDVQDLGGSSLSRILQLAAAGYAGSTGGISDALSSFAMDETVMSRRLKFGDYNLVFGWAPVADGDTPESIQKQFSERVISAMDQT